ncbi:lipopolysaccharide biosynthesis protein RfbH [Clostridium butyricum]|uniref:lipopolysaccharide biosynthesis protein RfbH n=1 Tax=Clostridium butyricum TaxID=1492 RepID=UPI001371A542|nr:lipopolysaccharide biosynthesis protein RfbH [Clostridium butyricum]MZI81044.1 lipopolysaccharide biosynthesis protein RfbH [Clostridium butyricum]
MFNNITEKEARDDILNRVKDYYTNFLKNRTEFKEGDKITYSGRIFDENEICSLVDSSLDFWLTMGRYSDKFEKEFAEFLNVKYCSVVNSGSSANLLAFSALTSPSLKERKINRGDEVITVAAAFPTTVSPIIQYGAIPVFVDVSIPQYNIDVDMLEKALSEKTKAVMIAHTLGNPFDLKSVREFCDKYNLWLIEDNCDALGSKYYIDNQWRYTGTIGDIGTSSFYPPHHITMGEGGAVYTNNSHLNKIIKSMRDWGRDCVCPSGVDNFCKNRFNGQYGELPKGYDHKYVYSQFGYNLKITDMQAAIGCEQIKKINSFIECRKNNWNMLRTGLDNLKNEIILPEVQNSSDPSWFGFAITLKAECKKNREDFVKYLENHNIQTRMLFAGNLIKHPCFNEMRRDNIGFRVVGSLDNTDRIMKDTFWIGVYPGMSLKSIQYMINVINGYFL